MAQRRDKRGRYSGTAGGGTTRRNESQAVARRNSRAQDVSAGRGPIRRERSATKQLKAQETAAKASKVYAKRSAVLSSTGGTKLGGSGRTLKSRSTVQDTVRKNQPRVAARRVAIKGGNALQQRAAANKAARRDMRRSSTRNAAGRRMMAAAFG